MKIMKVPIERILPHERFNEDHALELVDWLKRENCQIRPIVISPLDNFGHNGYYVNHDGHHRVEGLRRLGCRYVMATVIDFFEPKYKALHWHDGYEISKEEIINAALTGKPVQSRWTKHFVEQSDKWKPFMDNDLIEPRVYFPLDKLRVSERGFCGASPL